MVTVTKGEGGLAQMANNESPTQVYPKTKEGTASKTVTKQGPPFRTFLSASEL